MASSGGRKKRERRVFPTERRNRPVEKRCWSQVGMETLGAQDLNLGPGCEFTQVVIHELGHAVGFFHEQSRSDRDSSVLILWENVPRDTYSQFTHTYDINYDVPYDVTSVMQYSQSAFSPDPYEKNTIVTLDPHMQLRMGNKQLSFRDRKLANLMYTCSDSCPNIVDLKCENEGFLFKAATAPASEPCTCVCPHNSQGERCEDLTESYYGVPSCGGNITSEGTFETPGFPNRDVNYESCTWWIQAPEGQVAQLTFDEFSFASRLDAPSNKYDGKCVYERVEVRLRDRYRGEMYCGTDIKPGQQMSSRTSDAVIIVSRKRSVEGKGLRATVHFVHKNVSGMVDGIQNIVSGAISSASNLVSAQMTGK
ncbi:blastula protease 10-like [Ixodes scapularis]|uniref:blastula protease 10-like n=1 Tax=Ixodes scapularis TaxID=6945 RepID=UPI001C37F6D3|nr:blastula protease 10-like [Ixodes scapularis]